MNSINKGFIFLTKIYKPSFQVSGKKFFSGQPFKSREETEEKIYFNVDESNFYKILINLINY